MEKIVKNNRELELVTSHSSGYKTSLECRKKGKNYTKVKYLENKKSFIDKLKSNFHSFWAIIWWKK